MSQWKDIQRSVTQIGRFVEHFFSKIGIILAFIPEVIGTACFDGFYGLTKKSGNSKFIIWPGSIIKDSFSITGSAIKAIFGIIGAALGSVIKISGGILTAQSPVIFQGIWDLLSPTIGSIILLVGKLISLVQNLLFLQGPERPLSESEKGNLRSIFGKGMNFYLIRFVEGRSGIFDASDRAFTLGNTIYLKTDSFPFSLIVHECNHSWQYQNFGNRYTADALAAQWYVDDAYNWFKEIDRRKKTNWRDFNPEAQAEFLEDIWKHGKLADQNGTLIDHGRGSFYKADNKSSFGHFTSYGRDLSEIANRAIIQVRKKWFSFW